MLYVDYFFFLNYGMYVQYIQLEKYSYDVHKNILGTEYKNSVCYLRLAWNNKSSILCMASRIIGSEQRCLQKMQTKQKT